MATNTVYPAKLNFKVNSGTSILCYLTPTMEDNYITVTQTNSNGTEKYQKFDLTALRNLQTYMPCISERNMAYEEFGVKLSQLQHVKFNRMTVKMGKPLSPFKVTEMHLHPGIVYEYPHQYIWVAVFIRTVNPTDNVAPNQRLYLDQSLHLDYRDFATFISRIDDILEALSISAPLTSEWPYVHTYIWHERITNRNSPLMYLNIEAAVEAHEDHQALKSALNGSRDSDVPWDVARCKIDRPVMLS